MLGATHFAANTKRHSCHPHCETVSQTARTKFYETLQHFYQHSPFVVEIPIGKTANLKDVANTNQCHVSLHEDLASESSSSRLWWMNSKKPAAAMLFNA